MEAGNRLGDTEITDPHTMRALAHPVRLSLLDQLRQHGPATATELSPKVGATPSVTSWHLRHLASFGLVRDSEPGSDRRARRWEAASRGFRFEFSADPADEEGAAAARVLSEHLFARSAELPRRWIEDVEPRLDPAWRRLAGLSNTRVVVSRPELERIGHAIEQILAPYVLRDPDERPASSRGVRLMRYVLPEADVLPEAGDEASSPTS